MKPPATRRDLIESAFLARFGAAPTIWCRAPGRVDLMGSHTDYNLGAILTLPINHDTWFAVRPNQSPTVRLLSLNLDAEGSFELDSREKSAAHPWLDYVHGVAAMLAAEGLPVAGFDGVIHSTVPMSSGLSSSAALECAAATAFEALGGWDLTPLRKALLCQRAENRFVGVNCGILDQYTSCLGQAGCALLLDCRDLSSRTVIIPADLGIVVCDTRSKRELAGSEYGERRAQCEQGAAMLGAAALCEIPPAVFAAREHELPPLVAKRCRFIIAEHARVGALATALADRNLTAIRHLTAASFDGARDFYEIVSPPMDAMMTAMLAAPGVIGARQAGAGFGGCLVAFVHQSHLAEFTAAVHTRYETLTGIRPEIHPVTAAAGAGLIADFSS